MNEENACKHQGIKKMNGWMSTEESLEWKGPDKECKEEVTVKAAVRGRVQWKSPLRSNIYKGKKLRHMEARKGNAETS